MKALVLYGPGKFGFESSWPEPAAAPGWVRVRVRYAGICGSDLPRFATTGSYHHPMILGHEFAGVVETPAEGSRRIAAGQHVAVLPIIPCGECEGCATGKPFHCTNYQFIGSRNDGGFAEYCVVPEQNLMVLPPEVDLRAGAFIEPLAVALHVVRRSGFQPGGQAIVFGAGAIGILTAVWLRAFDATRVVIADIRPESLQTAKKAGFDDVIDARSLSDADSKPGVQTAQEHQSHYGWAFEAAGSAKALSAAVGCVKSGGTVTVVGRDTADTVIALSDFEALMRKEIDLKGCWGYDLAGEASLMLKLLKSGDLPIGALISHEIDLSESPGMIRRMINRETYFTKVMLRIA